MRFVSCSLERRFVEGFDLVGTIRAPSSLEGLVADIFQFPIPSVAKLLLLLPSPARSTLDSKFAVPV